MRTTTRTDWKFVFGISDLGKLLGKSPVTLRDWESKGLIDYPRDKSGDRVLTCDGVRQVTQFALSTGRIKDYRAHFIESIMTQMEFLEYLNNEKVKR